MLAQLVQVTDRTAVSVAVAGPPSVGDTSEERHAVESLQAGDADITLVRAGVLQQLGAESLAPLGAPFVVTNNDQAAAIAADPELSEQLLSGLDDIWPRRARPGPRRTPAPLRLRHRAPPCRRGLPGPVHQCP